MSFNWDFLDDNQIDFGMPKWNELRDEKYQFCFEPTEVSIPNIFPQDNLFCDFSKYENFPSSDLKTVNFQTSNSFGEIKKEKY